MLRYLKMYHLLRRVGIRNTWHTLRHLPQYLQFYLRLFNDPRTPKLAKAMVVGVVIYLFSPLDFIPDFIPFMGQMDDLTLILSVHFFLTKWIQAITQANPLDFPSHAQHKGKTIQR